MLDRLAAHRRRTLPDEAIHIVALWNLMIILIPFLLLSAVFSQTSILNLYLPPPAKPSEAPGINPTAPRPVVSILHDGYLLSDGPTVVAAIPLDAAGRHNTGKLTELLAQIKGVSAERSDLVILSEATTPYETIVQTMDASREMIVHRDGHTEMVSLFPDISLGAIGARAVQSIGPSPRSTP